MNPHEIVFAVMASTGLILMLVCFIIYLIIRCKGEFRRGIKWAEDNKVDMIQYAIKNLPMCITYEGITWEFNILHNGDELRLCYDMLMLEGDGPHKQQWVEFGCWDNPFTGGTCSFLYLREGIESLDDLIEALQECHAFLHKHGLLDERIG